MKHDSRYKQLFSNPRMLEELFHSFVDEDLAESLDFSTAMKIDKSFVSEEFKQTESDLIIRVRRKNTRKTAYLYLLLEFQSTPDPTMPIRVLHYLLAFYRSLPKFQRLCREQQLPPIFPLVLYNGDKKWTYCDSVERLISNPNLFRSDFTPKFNMNLLEINKFTDHKLLKIQNAVSALFILENTPMIRIRKNIRKIVNLIQQEDPETVENFRRWVMHYLGDDHPERDFINSTFDVNQRRDPGMFAKNAALFMEKEREKGRKRGFIEGLRETARKMKAKGLKDDLIIELTGISEKDLSSL